MRTSTPRIGRLVPTLVLGFLGGSACISGCSGANDAASSDEALGADKSKTDAGADASKDPGTGATDGGATSGDGGTALSRCTVTKEGTKGILLEGTVLAPASIIDNGQVFVDSTGLIQCVGTDCSGTSGASAASVISCPQGVISPGLINPHDHITYANDPPVGHGTIRYESRQDWRTGDHGFTKLTGTEGGATPVQVYAHELRFLMGGATSTVGSGGEVGLVRNLDEKADLDGLSITPVYFDTFPLDDAAGVQFTSGCTGYSSSRETESQVSKDSSYEPHIAEGIDLEAHNELTCTTATGTYDIVQKQTAVIHSVAASAANGATYASVGASVIWSPRSNISLYGNTAPVTMFDAQGVNVSLGTDWLPSGSMNMLREIACADSFNQTYLDKHFTDEQLWQMVTANAAHATGVDGKLGSLAVGLTADIAIFDGSANTGYRAVLSATNEDVVLVLRGGTALYGDAALVGDAALGGSICENLEVCGGARKACVAKDTSKAETLAAVISAGNAIYPMVSCKGQTPTNEPTCTPYRGQSGETTTNYSGVPSSTDQDGDGIADAADDCPTVFNPIRLMDGTAQADADGDGTGDLCDSTP